MSYVISTDVGGTCTDTVIVENGQQITVGKALSTPPDFANGIIDSIRSAADALDIGLEQLFAESSLFTHGCTVVDNALLERSGSTTGLITTRGFEDTLEVTRGAYGRWSGLSEEGLKHPVATDKPSPLVPLERVRGVSERVDYKGEIVTPLDEKGVHDALRSLLDKVQCDAIAVCLLWSHKEPAHEQRIREIIRDLSPAIYVSLSSDIAPVPGEYERTSTTVINAYAGRVVNEYLGELQGLLDRHGYRGPLLVMQGYGGLLPAAEAADRAVNMLECGPVAGVIGSKFLGDMMGDENIIAADMGGTTFKVGIIQNGELEYAREPQIDRFHYTVPKIDVVSIGAGGGSLIRLEAGTGIPVVGPRSAGARPGPICYGQGGEEPTLTDVLLLIGYIDPGRFLSGSMTLDLETTKRIFNEKIASPMGMTVEEAAFGIFRIANAQSSDLIHKITVEQGLDPRDFVLHAFGGSCPMLASAFAEELQVKHVLVPYAASVNCAFGLATADIVHEYAHIETLSMPANVESINSFYAPMLEEARQALDKAGFSEERMQFKWSVACRYALQVHEIITPVHAATPLDQQGLDTLVKDFESLYESRYGRGSAYRDAGIEMTQFRLTASGLITRPRLEQAAKAAADASAALVGERQIYVDRSADLARADIYDFEKLLPGHRLAGPAVIHTPITTIVVQDRQEAHMDGYRNILIETAQP